MFFDYAEAGSYAEETLRANRADLERIKLRQRVLVDVSQRDLAHHHRRRAGAAAARRSAPVGAHRHAAPRRRDRSPAAPRRRPAFRSRSRTMSICSIEDVAEAVDKPFWFQLYVMKDRGFVKSLIERAAAAKCSALVLTIDLQVLGQRHCDVRNGLTVPPAIRLQERARHRHQAGLGARHAARQAQDLRQSRRLYAERRQRRVAGVVDLDASSIRRCRGRTSSGSGACGPAS